MTTPTTTVDDLRRRITAKGPWFDVPAGTPDADCARCDADDLFWIATKSGKKMLVDCGVPGGVRPITATCGHMIGRGVAHFATCPHAASFRKRA